MESKWYLFPGQTLQNTKISDRAHVLHIAKPEWGKITQHLDRKKMLQEAIDKELAVRKYLEDGSRAMTQGWENSLENVRKRKEEDRLKHIEKKKDERMQKFLEMRKEQEAVRKEYREKVEKQIFMTTGYARALTSALITSEVLYERGKQLEFKDKLKNKDKEDDMKFALKIREDAVKEVQEKEIERKKLFEKEKKYKETLKQMVKDTEDCRKKAREERIKEEALDNIEACKEMEILEKKIIDEKLAKKKEQAAMKKKMLKESEERRIQKEKEEQEFEDVTTIYREAKHRLDCMKKQREKELQDEVVARRNAVTKLVAAEAKSRDEEENRAIRQSVKEMEERELEKVMRRAKIDEKNKQERLEDRIKCLERERINKEKEEETKKWHLLNRYKTDENMKKYEENKKREAWEKILNYKEELLDQIEENRQEAIREKLIDEAFIAMNMEEEDERFFSYANEVLELAKKKGRSCHPIEKVIQEYTKNFSIKTRNHSLSSNKVPIKPDKM